MNLSLWAVAAPLSYSNHSHYAHRIPTEPHLLFFSDLPYDNEPASSHRGTERLLSLSNSFQHAAQTPGPCSQPSPARPVGRYKQRAKAASPDRQQTEKKSTAKPKTPTHPFPDSLKIIPKGFKNPKQPSLSRHRHRAHVLEKESGALQFPPARATTALWLRKRKRGQGARRDNGEGFSH